MIMSEVHKAFQEPVGNPSLLPLDLCEALEFGPHRIP